MANTTITPNMSLIVPTVGQDPGPDWANNINASLGILDQHNHSSGQGVQITPTGLNINTDLPINSNNLTSVKTVNFLSLAASLPGSSPNLGCVYVTGSELYYNDEVGNVVPLTKNGSVNSGAGSITGLPSGTASASYSSGSATFIFQSATSTPASIDAGSVIIRNVSANGKGVTVSAPSALGANYGVVLPALPAAPSVVTLDTSGNFGTAIVGNPRASGSSVAAGGVALSSNCGSFSTSSTSPTPVTNLVVSITTTGRPVKVMIQHDGLASDAAGLIYNPTGISNGAAFLYIFNGSIQITNYQFGSSSPSINVEYPGSLSLLDLSVNGTPGTYTYTIKAAVSNGTSSVQVFGCVLSAYEI